MVQDKNLLVKLAQEGADRYYKAQVEYLKEFCSIDCGTHDEEGNAKTVEVVDRLLSEIKGIEIEHAYCPGYGIHVIARLRPENPSGKILLNAHIDTVFNKGDTLKYPFRIDGDTAYGLGIVDCKGGIVVAVYAVKIMQELNMLPNKEIVFLFNCDEEIGSPSSHEVFKKELPGAEMAFVFEASRDDDGVIVARKASCGITIDVRGKQAHAGVNYLDGRSATVELAHKILALYNENIHERGIQFNVAALYGGDTGTGVVSDHATAEVGVRVANQADIATVKEILAKVEKDTFIEGTTSRVFMHKEGVPMERTEANVKLYEMVRSASLLMGHDLVEQTSGGTGDSSFFSSHGIASADALGPYMYKFHSHDESMRLSSLVEKTRLFSVVLGFID